ncbi:hypothetical protein KUTeg_008819 [Tegillarca granosa]|uniref:Ubiquitin carboxyl-terminal hydrolase MINDY n=1 Tax=Tegillarca granosa TaxID=220873 RepID=A0ABQ9FA83_TEGGR|nr:hypothetical protein KUTeg_008819 [Tegillarca granosa]
MWMYPVGVRWIGQELILLKNQQEEPSRRKYHKPRPVSAGIRGNQKLNLFSSTLKDETNDQNKPSRKDVDNANSDCIGRLSPADNKISVTNTSDVDYLINEQRKTSIKDVLELESEKPKPAVRRQSSSELKHYDVDISSISERPPTRGGNSVGRPTSSSSNTPSTSKVGDVEIGDMDDLDEDVANLDLGPRLPVYKPIQNTVDAKPIDLNTAIALKTLIFGAGNLCFNDEWKYQCFNFCDIPKLKYGIVQKKGGPCGVTASVQACMLLELLFGENKVSKSRYSDPTREERTKCLAVALAKIFWRAGQQKCAVVVL